MIKSRSKTQRQKLRGGSYLFSTSTPRKKYLILSASLAWMLASFALVWGVLFVNGVVTLGGVPASIVGKFIQDSTALGAFFTGNKVKLHERLEKLGIEEDIKAYYRPYIRDEVQLDQYIHQLLYNWTGYVGNNYVVTPRGTLVLKGSALRRIEQDIKNEEL